MRARSRFAAFSLSSAFTSRTRGRISAGCVSGTCMRWPARTSARSRRRRSNGRRPRRTCATRPARRQRPSTARISARVRLASRTGPRRGRHGRGGDDRRRADPRRIRKGENAQDHRVAPGIDGVGRAGAVAASTPPVRAVVFGDGEVAAFQGAGAEDRVALPDLPGPARPVAVEGRAVEVAPESEAAVAAPLEARCDGDDLTVEAAVELAPHEAVQDEADGDSRHHEGHGDEDEGGEDQAPLQGSAMRMRRPVGSRPVGRMLRGHAASPGRSW